MSETLCTCTNQNCGEAHDIETAERAVYKIWFTGEMAETVTFADAPQDVIAEIKGLIADAPDDFPGWRIRNRATKTTVSAPKFFAEHGA